MGGIGPAPKSPEQRRRRNAAAPLDALPADGYRGRYPKLPATYASAQRTKRGAPKRERFLAQTRKWYEAWATSPMATEFTTVHWLRLQDVAVLQDRYNRGELELAGELRLQLAGFGGTPFDLRRLGKQIRAGGGAGSGDKGPAEPPKTAEVRRLHAV